MKDRDKTPKLKRLPDTIDGIVAMGLCSGCGGCLNVCRKIGLVEGARFNYPVIDQKTCSRCQRCVLACPGAGLLERMIQDRTLRLQEKPVESYVAYSSEPEIRRRSASGGIVTSLLIFLLDEQLIDGAICVRQKGDQPLANEVIVAGSRGEIGSCMGSRYGPVSVCAGFNHNLAEDRRYALVGKPCEIEALTRIQQNEKMLQQVGYKIALMCAGTPGRTGTRELITQGFAEKVENTVSINYRGDGWPGMSSISAKDGRTASMPYFEAWNHYLAGRWNSRCRLCDDSFGSLADITVGDAWGREYLDQSAGGGFSCVLLHSEKGKKCFSAALVKGAIIVHEAISYHKALEFQKYLVAKNTDDLQRAGFLISQGYRVNMSRLKTLSQRKPIRFLKLGYQVIKYLMRNSR